MVIDRSKHNKFVGLPEKTTDTGGTTGASGSSSGDGSTTVIIGGGGGTANLDPELIEELRNQEAFSYINISDGQNTILTAAQIEKDYFNLAIQGDGETSETQVSSDKYLPRTQIAATGSIPGSYWVVFNHIQVPDEGPDGEPVYKDIWRIELTKMSPDPAVRPNIDYNGIELIYQGVSQGVYSLSDNRVSVQSTDSEDTLTITINQDSYIDFDTLQLVWTQDANHTPVTTLPGIAIQNYVTVTITQAGATRFWKLDEYGNLYTDYNAYSNLDLGAKGQLWTDTGLYVGNFTQGISGGVFYVQNEQGDTYIEADRMRIRKKAYFETLEIINVNSVGGKQIISPAGAVTLRKVEETTITDADGTETPVYRCYFMGEQDGVEIENRWHIGDQAFSQNFNIRTPGEYEQVANHYFWRLVVGLSTELDDNGNYYIDLSVNDCDQDSDPPHVNDVVAQLGNRNDVDRQSALILSSVDAESPRIILCHGIDSYTLANTEYFDVGVDHAENRAYVNVYGDTYIGDRNNIDESKGYVYYDSSTQTLNIRASISASSTIGDKKFSEVFVTAENFENMTNAVLGPQLEYIQNQIDGTVEAYFYDYSPTLENEPAFTWREEGKQNEHLGDTFTNIQTYISDEETPDAGKSWRWVLKDGVYGWEPIADSDAVAALKKAAEAQDTADGKRRIFVTQPTQEQAYDIGDLWVNATYSDGSVTYNNDILRANTAKQAGYPFSISHWGQASAYRDLYDQALQKAQAAADAAGDVQTAVDLFKTDIEETFQDGVITTSEASRLRTLIDTINTTVYNAKQTFNDVYNNSYLEGTTEKSNLLTAYNAFIADTDDDPNTITPRIVAIIEQLLAKVDNTQTPYQITKGDISSINQEYATFNDNYEDYIVALNAANLKITSQIANTAEASAVAKYAYLENLFSGKTTINGAVITTGMMVVGTENSATGEYQVNGGFSGVINDAELGDGMAIWYGGDKIDAETSSDHNDRIAGSLLRYDGSGYFGAKWVQDSKGDWNVEYGIRWDKDGVVTVDPATFWVGEEKIDLLLQVFNAIDSEPSDGVTDEVVMRVPFREVLIGSAYIGYDAANNSVYVYKQNQDGTREACNFYATGEVTAYGSSYEDESPEYARYVRDLKDVNYGGNVDPDSADTLLMWNGTTWKYIDKNEVGLNEVQLETYLTENEYAKKSDLITDVGWSAITGKPTTLAGYGITDAYTEAESDSMFVIKSGDVMRGTLTIQYGGDYKLVFNNTDGERLSIIDFRENGTSYGYLAMRSTSLSINCPNNLITVGGHAVLHEGNYTSTLDTRYVKKSGDTMTGALKISTSENCALILNTIGNVESFTRYRLDGVNGAAVGYYDSLGSYIYNYKCRKYLNITDNAIPQFDGNIIWHAGNDGSGSGLDADLLDGYHRNNLFYSFLNQIESLDFTSEFIVNGDANTYYPVRIEVYDKNSKHLIQQVSVWRNLGEQCADYSGNHVEGTSSLWICYEYRSTVWDGNGGFIRTTLNTQPYANLCADAKVNTQMFGCIILWLRGGGTIYHVSSTGGKPSCYIYYERTNIQNSTYPIYIESRTTRENDGIINWGNHYSYINTYGGSAWATKLETPRTIWGQSFDGTANISGELNGCTRIRNTSNQPIYLGEADNSSWVYTQDIASHNGTGAWALNINGHGWLQKLNIGYPHPNEGSFPLNVQGTISSTSLSTQNIRIECDNSSVLGDRGNEINNYNSHLYLQYDTSTNLICCMGGGNVGIGTTSPAFEVDVVGSIRCQKEWFRTTGNTGWYSETYHGGIYMEDSTWVRVYNDKGFYVNNEIRADAYSFVDGNDSDIRWCYSSGRIAAGERIARPVSVGSLLVSSSWSDGVNVPTHGIWCKGQITCNSNIVATGEVTAYGSASDMRLKQITETEYDALSIIDGLSTFKYKWNDLAKDIDGGDIFQDNYEHYGLSAQELQKVSESFISKSKVGDKYLILKKEELVPLLVAAIKQLSKKIKNLENK